MERSHTTSSREELEEISPVLVSKTYIMMMENGACDYYTIQLRSEPQFPVRVLISTDSTCVSVSPSRVYFTKDTWSTVQAIRVDAEKLGLLRVSL